MKENIYLTLILHTYLKEKKLYGAYMFKIEGLGKGKVYTRLYHAVKVATKVEFKGTVKEKTKKTLVQRGRSLENIIIVLKKEIRERGEKKIIGGYRIEIRVKGRRLKEVIQKVKEEEWLEIEKHIKEFGGEEEKESWTKEEIEESKKKMIKKINGKEYLESLTKMIERNKEKKSKKSKEWSIARKVRRQIEYRRRRRMESNDRKYDRSDKMGIKMRESKNVKTDEKKCNIKNGRV